MTTCKASDGEARDGPHQLTHLSYSGLTAYLKCGKAYELGRLLGLAEQPSWWSIGGRAVHGASEESDRERFARRGD